MANVDTNTFFGKDKSYFVKKKEEFDYTKRFS